jgi:cob(I)alamin adenosyltransferase
MSEDKKKDLRHKKSMEKQKANVDHSIAEATDERGLVILLTGDGKGKSSSAFGMAIRSLGYNFKVGIIQFIKGVQLSGEEIFIRDKHPEVYFHQMGTGFTWDTQDRTGDIEAAKKSWQHAEKLLSDPSIYLVILDELTYMLSFKYLEEEKVLAAIRSRPREQTVVVTGRGGGSAMRELADTVSEIKDIKHAFNAKIKARKGVDY